jgi:hypothetical protein
MQGMAPPRARDAERIAFEQYPDNKENPMYHSGRIGRPARRRASLPS